MDAPWALRPDAIGPGSAVQSRSSRAASPALMFPCICAVGQAPASDAPAPLHSPEGNSESRTRESRHHASVRHRGSGQLSPSRLRGDLHVRGRQMRRLGDRLTARAQPFEMKFDGVPHLALALGRSGTSRDALQAGQGRTPRSSRPGRPRSRSDSGVRSSIVLRTRLPHDVRPRLGVQGVRRLAGDRHQPWPVRVTVLPMAAARATERPACRLDVLDRVLDLDRHPSHLGPERPGSSLSHPVPRVGERERLRRRIARSAGAGRA